MYKKNRLLTIYLNNRKILIFGKFNCELALTMRPRFDESDPVCPYMKVMQISQNQVLRTMQGKKISDRIPIATLLARSKVMSMNQIAIERCAIGNVTTLRTAVEAEGMPLAGSSTT
jgi:hypothetical protein